MLRAFLRRLTRRGARKPPQFDDFDDFDWLTPPSDTEDASAWDRYWDAQVSHGLGPPLFDMFCDDGPLVEAMWQRGASTVLCVGNGISQEPRALAQAGFRVIALDLSPTAVRLSQAWNFGQEELRPFFDPSLRRPGGSVEYVVGSILDPSICTGPFDAIIERRTLQLFLPDRRMAALESLAARLGPDGIFLSHCHDGGWRPPAEPFHATAELFFNAGWTISRERELPEDTGRTAWLVTSTG